MVEEKGEKEINECIYINKLLLLKYQYLIIVK